MPINYPDNVKHNNSAFPIISASDLTVQGWYHVASTTERDDIPAAKRLTGAVVVVGTTVYVYTGGTLDDTAWQTSGNWAAVTTGSLSWGSIAGTLSNQTDLQSALDAKANSSHTHVLADITDSGALAALNTVGSSEIDDHSITSAKILNGSITEGDIGADEIANYHLKDNAVTSAKILNGTITEGDIGADEIASYHLKDDSVTQAKIAFQTVDSSEIAPDAIVTSKIADLAVQGIKLGDSSVSAAKLANNAVEEAKISNNAVTENKIAADAVTSSRIADGAVTAAHIADNTITTVKIGDQQVTTDKLAVNAVSTSRLQDGSVTASKIVDGNVTNTKIQNGGVTTEKLAAGAVTSQKIASGGVAAWNLNPSLEEKLVYKEEPVEPFMPWSGEVTGTFSNRRTYSPFELDRFMGRGSELVMDVDGNTLSDAQKRNLTNQSYSLAVNVAAAGGNTGVLTIDLETNGMVSSNGFVYAQGLLMLTFYSGRGPVSMSCRTQDRDGTWTNRTCTGHMTSSGTAGATEPVYWGVQLSGNYLVKIELTMTSQSGQAAGLGNISYLGTRMQMTQGPQINTLGGKFFGQISGVQQGTTNWTIDQDGSADFDSLTVQGSPITSGADGADGLGFTGGSYSAATGVVTFTSDDGLGFSTSDLRGADGADGSDALALAGNDQTLTGNRTIDDGNTGKLFFIDLEAASGEKSQVLMNPNTPSIFLQANDGASVSAFTIGSANINLQFTGTSDLRVNNDEGTSGQVLTSNGTGEAPTWEYPEALHIPRWTFADFNAIQATSNSPFVGAASNGGNANGAVNNDAFTTTGSGWAMIRANTGGTSGYRWDTQQQNTNFQAGMSYVAIFNTHANSTDRQAWFGFKDTTLNVQSNQGVYYTLDGLTLTATLDRSSGTFDTGTGQTLSANTTYMVEIKANSASSFTFYLYAAPTGNQPGALIHSETLTMTNALDASTNMRVGMSAVRTTTGTANYELLALDYMGFGYR